MFRSEAHEINERLYNEVKYKNLYDYYINTLVSLRSIFRLELRSLPLRNAVRLAEPRKSDNLDTKLHLRGDAANFFITNKA